MFIHGLPIPLRDGNLYKIFQPERTDWTKHNVELSETREVNSEVSLDAPCRSPHGPATNAGVIDNKQSTSITHT